MCPCICGMLLSYCAYWGIRKVLFGIFPVNCRTIILWFERYKFELWLQDAGEDYISLLLKEVRLHSSLSCSRAGEAPTFLLEALWRLCSWTTWRTRITCQNITVWIKKQFNFILFFYNIIQRQSQFPYYVESKLSLLIFIRQINGLLRLTEVLWYHQAHVCTQYSCKQQQGKIQSSVSLRPYIKSD